MSYSIHPSVKIEGKRTNRTTSAPPRTRPGKKYPGGKRLRKRLERLSLRRLMREQGIADRRRECPGIVNMHKNVPGSMTH